MKKICSNGFRVSSVDRKAFEHYVLKSEADWSFSALKGMINKAVKTIMRDWFEIYKAKQTGTIPADYAIVIPAIIAIEEFTPYNSQTPQVPIVNRKESKSIEIWANGFDIEDYEEAALNAYYSNPVAMLEYFMENKIHARRSAFVKENEKGFFERKEAIPVNQDDFINLVCLKSGYKNRQAQEEEVTI